jgi:hypothetical protein
MKGCKALVPSLVILITGSTVGSVLTSPVAFDFDTFILLYAGVMGPKYVFVLGTGRCGSTLIHEVLARHPDVAFLSNVEDRLPHLVLSGRFNGPVFRRMPVMLTKKGRFRFAPSEGYRLFAAQASPILSEPMRDLTREDATPWLRHRVSQLLDRHATRQDKPVFLHKFTGWPRARFLDGVLPNTRFIHIVRDGRAVANSWLQMPWWRGYQGPDKWQFGPLPNDFAREWEEANRSFVILAAIGWKMLMDAFEEARESLRPEQWLQLRYEDFLDDRNSATREMLDFADLEWSPAFESGLRRYNFQQGRRDAFRTELDALDLAELEKSLAQHLKRYCYTTNP